MPISEAKQAGGGKSYTYTPPSKEVLYYRLETLLEAFKRYVSQFPDVSFPDDVAIDSKAIGDMVVRVDKRRDYFLVFHDNTEMNEVKEAALYAYWILKFRPFSIANGAYRHINETFAVFVIFSVLQAKSSKCNKSFKVSESYVKKLVYAFAFWDMSKESIIMLAETLSEILDKTT